MKYTAKCVGVLTCLAVVFGSGHWAWAEQQGKVGRKTRFEQFRDSFGAPRTGPVQGEKVRQMSPRRRIILNDDGEAASGGRLPDGTPGAPAFATIEELLDARFNSCVDTQVDSYFWGIQTPWYITGYVPGAQEAIIGAARRAGMEIFASLRMNDIHDAWRPELWDPLKLSRPDVLLGTQEGKSLPQDAIMNAFWSGFDYAKPEVRQYILDFIDSYCRKYDYDGLELDYFRHPLFFKLGEEEQNLPTMTGFVRQVRQILDEIGRGRGRPYLLAIHVPDSPELARRTGLDVERWLKEGLLDLLIVGGGYMPYAGRYKKFIDLAHRYDVPAYACINHFQEPIQMRSWASNFWALGADGVYVFNYAGVPQGSDKQRCLTEMGDANALVGLDKQYLPDNGGSTFYCGHVNPPRQFPVRLIDGTPIELVVGDDLVKAARQGILEEACLRVKVANMDESEGITITINSTSLPADTIKRVDAETFEAVVTASLLQRGINHIVILPGLHSIGRLSSTVEGLELPVRYK